MDDQPTPRKKPGPKPATKAPAETKEEREQRNLLILMKFLAGHSEREIGRSVGITGARVHQIIKAELKEGARHQQLLTDQALSVYSARLEFLLRSVWPKVIQQDLKAVEVARRLMEQQAKLYNIDDERVTLPPMAEQELLSDETPVQIDELTRFRMRHRSDDESGAV